MKQNSVKDHINDLHQKTKALIDQNLSEAEIIDELRKDDVDELYAKTLIENVSGDNRDRKDFWKLLLMGICLIAGALAINYFSYTIAVQSGSFSFYLFWGVIVAGLLMIVRAFILFRK